MHKLFLDTEFNGHGGRLISLALASAATSGKDFYEVLQLPDNVHPWVKVNVVPLLDKEPVSDVMFHHKLREYLQRREPCTVYADWPADFVHLYNSMLGPGFDTSFVCDMTCKLIPHAQPVPLIPHNALSDAQALRDWYLAAERANDIARGAISEC